MLELAPWLAILGTVCALCRMIGKTRVKLPGLEAGGLAAVVLLAWAARSPQVRAALRHGIVDGLGQRRTAPRRATRGKRYAEALRDARR